MEISTTVRAATNWCLGSSLLVLTLGGCSDEATHGSSGPADAQVGDLDAMVPRPDLDGGRGSVDAQIAITPIALYGSSVGRKWIYTVHSDASASGCGSSDTTAAETVRAYDAGGFQGFEVTGPCTSAAIQMRYNGSDVEQSVSDAWVPVLKAPVMEGAAYDSLSPYRFEWRSLGSVKVAAGTFQNCWLRKSIAGSLLDTTYCAGVGRIMMTTPRYTIELLSVSP